MSNLKIFCRVYKHVKKCFESLQIIIVQSQIKINNIFVVGHPGTARFVSIILLCPLQRVHT